MPDVKISALPAATTPLAGTEVLPIVQSSTTKKVSVADLTAGRAISASSITNSALTSGRVTYAGASGLLSDNANFVYDSSERLIVGASSAAIGNRMEVVSNTGSQAIGIRGRVSDGAGVISWHPNASATEYARIQSDSNSALMFGTGSSGTERMRITSAGLVGIGTSSPSYTLDVTGQIRASSGASASALIATSTSSGGTALNIQNSGTVNALIGGWLSCIGSGNATDVAIAAYQGALGFATNGANIRMTLDSSGNLGIGATSAGNKLQISNGGANGVEFDVALASGTESKMLSINRTSSAYTPLNYDASLHKFFISGGQKMQLDASGNLLVGTTSTITGTKFGATSTTTSGAGEFYVNSAGADAINAINIIKYSTTNTTAQQFIGFTINNANTGSGQINANGASQAAFGSFSDARLKENIVDLPSQLNNILALKPKEFDYIQSEGGGHQIGFVAQDMQTVYPDAISERTDGMLVVTGWSKTEARLVKAIQEQQALIESLTTRLTALENK